LKKGNFKGRFEKEDGKTGYGSQNRGEGKGKVKG